MGIKKCPDISPAFNSSSTELQLVEDKDKVILNTRRWYKIYSAGKEIGHVCLSFINDPIHRNEVEVSEVRMFSEQKGYGTKLYVSMGDILKREGYTLVSCAINEASTALWERLTRIGIATKKSEGNYEIN